MLSALRVHRDDGAAALELGLLLTVLLTLMIFFAPLVTLFSDQLRLGRTAGRAVRFATAVPDRNRPGVTARRPTAKEVVAEALVANGGEGSCEKFDATVSPAPSVALPGEQITVTVTCVRSLAGPMGTLLGVIGVGSTATLTATAVAREE